MRKVTALRVAVTACAVAVVLLLAGCGQDAEPLEVSAGAGPPTSGEVTPPSIGPAATAPPETTVAPLLVAPACSEFGSQGEAQAWFDENWASHDVSQIDTDGDGRPCTAVFAPPTTAAPRRSVSVDPVPPEPVNTPVADGSVWDQLAQCESGGNWAINTGNGYSGGLQFLHSTWTGYGGAEFAPMAYQASREAQIAVAERIRASHGGTYRAWPGCRAKLGLP